MICFVFCVLFFVFAEGRRERSVWGGGGTHRNIKTFIDEKFESLQPHITANSHANSCLFVHISVSKPTDDVGKKKTMKGKIILLFNCCLLFSQPLSLSVSLGVCSV